MPFPTLDWSGKPPLIPLGGRLVRGYLMECIGVKYRKINIYSQLSDYNSQKIILCERSSTLPPLICYISNSQYVRQGGIRVELWVELHVIPPIFHP